MSILKRTVLPESVKMWSIFLVVSLPFTILPFILVAGAAGNGIGDISGSGLGPAATIAELPQVENDHPMSAAARAKKNAYSQFPAPANVGFDASILSALKAMGLVVDHFDDWIEQHPGTALKHVKFMPAGMQNDVASTALFIRKSNGKIDAKTAWREAAALVHYSAKYGVPSALTTAVAHAESTFNPNAVSPKGAAGVMQVMWNIHNGLLQSNGITATPGDNPLADPELAIAAGCLLLSRYIRAYGNVQTAMDRYYGARSSSYRNKITRTMARILDHQAGLRVD